jgi:hypothetical protein
MDVRSPRVERGFQCSTRDRPRRNVLGKWYGSNAADIADGRQGSMHTDGFKDILNEFAPALDCIKPLCRKLRSILFPLTKDGELGTPTDPNTL